MATIKTITINASMPDARNRITGRYYKYYTFVTFIDHAGRKTYFLNGKVTDKDKGNEVFRNIMKNGKEIKRQDKTEELTYTEVIERLMKGYDQYVEYIDDPGQYREACEANDKIYQKVRKIKELMAEEGEA